MFLGITNDSRKVKKGDIFVAYQGVNEDLHQYIEQARVKGAVFVIGEKGSPSLFRASADQGHCDLIVKDGREVFSRLAAAWYGHSDKKLKLFAVTGTNGKTSTAKMIGAIFNEAKKGTAVFGTINYSFKDKIYLAKETTPDPMALHCLFKEFSDDGARYAILEASSQGLDQKRFSGLEFEAGIFTNLTQDHLDYHKTMANYLKAKMILFQQSKIIILNNDDPASTKIKTVFKDKKIITYGLEKKSDFMEKDLPKVLSLPGRFNQYNALAAMALARTYGISRKIIDNVLGKIKVPGRFEMIGDRVIVDYAHTPDALERLLENIREIITKGGSGGKIICVFGCGGDRDRGKRPIMGEIATCLADFTIITNDNPRTENANDIIIEIKKGVQVSRIPYFSVLLDRKQAIKKAIKMAGPSDLVVIAGKGHEDYQIIGNQKRYFSDQEEANKNLNIKIY
ncbi:UDP-N-acetylmuramoyl-L-alanyl-D-glutamate--2,6-diaminopimelate ligase [Candidatus Azambacteria bacterium]|nr:UDP-N-acetylmuramoyl-L-alanyl-D-glutamate--2,6-diaminopimelate ligase [Candidatus Azambacteria bacterium]